MCKVTETHTDLGTASVCGNGFLAGVMGRVAYPNLLPLLFHRAGRSLLQKSIWQPSAHLNRG